MLIGLELVNRTAGPGPNKDCMSGPCMTLYHHNTFKIYHQETYIVLILLALFQFHRMTYRLFPATYTYSLVKDLSGQWFVKAQVVDSNVVSLTALTASTNSAINQLLMRPEILTSVECDHGRLLIPSLKRNERSHTRAD